MNPQRPPIRHNPRLQHQLDWHEEILVDLFAGGGGMSTAMHMATGISPHIACNHDSNAISMHEANHPQTRHYQADVFELDPRAAVQGRPVGLLHASPDCTHHSQAAGGQPRDRKIRALSWVVLRWAGQVGPRVITLENVRQITKWGPLVAKRDKATRRVIKADGTVAAKGEVVPLRQQYLVPDTKRAGQSWQRFVRILRALGYQVEWRMLCAADYGAPTTRERLFLVARRDTLPIVWPTPTHYKQPARGQQRWRSAAECIDWSIPGRSIFNRAKPLAENTLKRIAKGITKFVLENPEPFVVGINGERPLVALQMDAAHGEGRGTTRRRGCGSHRMQQPLGTITASGGHALVCTWMMQANGGYYDISNATGGRSMRAPLSTITNSGSQQQLLSAYLMRQFGSSTGSDLRGLVGTIMADGAGGKTGIVECLLENQEDSTARALRVAAFLINYYGTAAREPVPLIDTLTTKERLARVTVQLNGIPYYITDITLRMLEPSELYRAQGFPDDYIFTHGHDDRVFSRAAQIRMCGNSVSPPPAVALLRANYDHAQEQVLRRAS
jgi:C-5 cytosine-specific DNA methylase family protein